VYTVNGLPVGADFPFQVGVTEVTVHAVDRDGRTASATLQVVVEDSSPPVLVIGEGGAVTEVVAECAGPNGTVVNLPAVTASDNADAAPLVLVDAPAFSGVGVTHVRISAADTSGNAVEEIPARRGARHAGAGAHRHR
jgi:hypothetical protein